MTRIPPICPYCMTPAKLVDSAEIYGRSFGNAWVCGQYPACDAYVGVHKATNEPLGRLANPELREAKKRAHAAFDPLWVNAVALYEPIAADSRKARNKAAGRIRRRARKRAYAWLAEQLGIDPDDCHIGFFGVEECDRVVALCEDVDAVTIRAWAKSREVT